jgi:hypothetical protein
VTIEAEKTRDIFVPDRPHNGLIAVKDSGGVLKYVSSEMNLTRVILLQGPEWTEWHQSKWRQLDRYKEQGVVGTPVRIKTIDTVFCIVWTYNVKVLDQQNKVRCACGGLVKAGQGGVLTHTYAGYIDHTSS